MFFYEKSSNSENPLYERKPQKADQIIVACGSTTPTGDYVIDKCGSSCVNKCNSGQELSPEGLCVPVCTGGRVRHGTTCQCPENQELEGGQCTCPEEFIVDKTTGKCREGKDCPGGSWPYNFNARTYSFSSTLS